MAAPATEEQPATPAGMEQDFKYRRFEKPRHHTRVRVIRRTLAARMEELVASAELPAGKKVLDYGCGEKPYEELLRKKFKEYIGADIPGNPKAQLVVGPQGELPLDAASVDCVISTQVLEHVDDPRVYLAEARRVLRAGGNLILSTHGHWRYHAHPHDYWRWTVQGLQKELARAGFQVVRMYPILRLSSAALQLWQDATSGSLPGPIRSLYIRFFQLWIWLIERRKPDEQMRDAAIYVILARKV